MDSLLAKSPCRNNVILGAEFSMRSTVPNKKHPTFSGLGYPSLTPYSFSAYLKSSRSTFFAQKKPRYWPRKGGKDTREVLTLSTEVELPDANILHVDALGYMNQHLDDRCYPWLSPGYHLVTHDNTYISYEHVHEVLWNCESHGGIKHRLSSAQDCR